MGKLIRTPKVCPPFRRQSTAVSTATVLQFIQKNNVSKKYLKNIKSSENPHGYYENEAFSVSFENASFWGYLGLTNEYTKTLSRAKINRALIKL